MFLNPHSWPCGPGPVPLIIGVSAGIGGVARWSLGPAPRAWFLALWAMSGVSTPAMSIGLHALIPVSRGTLRACGPGEGLEVLGSAGVEFLAGFWVLRWGLLELVQDGPDALQRVLQDNDGYDAAIAVAIAAVGA